MPANAAGGDRTLYLYYTHTKETARITFRRNGKYDQKGLAELNKFLRDWRRGEPTKMDPALFDLVWEVYRDSKATGPIHIVSAYRAPETNEMLRSRSSAVAKNSRHTMGMAMDFFIPGVKISDLRQIAMRKQVGGVGYYPTSGSPFVHLDTGNVRAWPRMTTAQLKKLFPDGRTLHVPTDGKPISSAGYSYAKAEWTRCHTVPCSSRSTSTIRVASADSSTPSTSGGNGATLLGWLFGNEADDAGEEEVAKTQAPTIQVASTSAIVATPSEPPVPLALPAFLRIPVVNDAPTGAGQTISVASLGPTALPQARPAWMDAAKPVAATAAIAVASLDKKPVPAPRELLSLPKDAEETLLAAYAPTVTPEPDAQRAVQMLIERRNQETARAVPKLNTEGLRIASASTNAEISSFASLFEGATSLITTGGLSLQNAGSNGGEDRATLESRMPTRIDAGIAFQTRAAELVAPDLEHVIDIFVDPSAMSSSRYAVIFDHDEADFSPDTALGAGVLKVKFSQAPHIDGLTNSFEAAKTLSVAMR